MITGFNEFTHDLTPYEKDTLLPKIVAKLSLNKGRAMAVTNRKICAYMKDRGYEISDARLRKIINVVRNAGIIPGLVATSAGYFVTDDPVEIARYVDSLKERANEINRVKESMQAYLREILKGRAA